MCVYVSVSYVIDISIVGVSVSGPVSDIRVRVSVS